MIGENGGVYFERMATGHGVVRRYWHPDELRATISERLKSIAESVVVKLPEVKFAEDQPFRLTSIAFSRPEDPALGEQIARALREAGADVTINNLWILGWLGGYDKLSMARRILAGQYGVDIDRERDSILYSGDSTNDAPMFGFFRHRRRQHGNAIPGSDSCRASLDHPRPRWFGVC